MKTLVAAILAAVAVCNICHADNILIYKGIESVRENNAAEKHYGYYFLFDLTTSQYQSVQFGPLGSLATPGNKFYSTGTTSVAFTGVPATEKGARTQTDFIYMSGSTGTPFDISFGDYKGSNVSRRDLGGEFSGAFPNVLTLVARVATGDGTTINDTVKIINGTFSLATKLTRSSNGNGDTGDDLPTAVTLVTSDLEHKGYRGE